MIGTIWGLADASGHNLDAAECASSFQGMVEKALYEWQREEKVKRREMVAPEARYIFVRELRKASAEDLSSGIEESTTCSHWDGDGDPVVGFVQYRFIVEEEVPVVYVYELQLEHRVQRRGLGKFLMQLIELIARKMGIEKSYEILCKAFDEDTKAKLEKLDKLSGYGSKPPLPVVHAHPVATLGMAMEAEDLK
ncbi:hypothetical protein ACLOJK_025568 [Asimina triloba]